MEILKAGGSWCTYMSEHPHFIPNLLIPLIFMEIFSNGGEGNEPEIFYAFGASQIPRY